MLNDVIGWTIACKVGIQCQTSALTRSYLMGKRNRPPNRDKGSKQRKEGAPKRALTSLANCDALLLRLAMFAHRTTCRRPFAPWHAFADQTAGKQGWRLCGRAAWIIKRLGMWFILVALAHPTWAESALFPTNRWFTVDALNGASLRGKGLTLFVEPDGTSRRHLPKVLRAATTGILGST